MTTSTGHPVAATAGPGRERADLALVVGLVRRLGLYLATTALTALLALPTLWLVLPPFRARRTLSMSATGFAAHNVRRLLADSSAVGSLRLALLVAGLLVALAIGCCALIAFLLVRARARGRDLLLYLTLLLCSVVAGTAATTPVFLFLHDLNLMDSRLSVMLVLSGSLLPAALFMLRDFVEALPRWNAQAARAFAPRRARRLALLTTPLASRGVAALAACLLVNVWGSLLAPLVPLGGSGAGPDPAVMYTIVTAAGEPDLGLIALFTVLYSTPLALMYLLAGGRYGFRLAVRRGHGEHGGGPG